LTKTEFDEFAHLYKNLASQNTKFFNADYDYFGRVRAEIVGRFSDPNTRTILDFGCGIGLSISPLRDIFFSAEIVGCDPSQDSLEIARTREPECKFLAPEAIPAVPRFDIVMAVCVFHHIAPANRDATLRYCYERLNRGGYLFVFEHNPYNPVTRHLVSTCPFDQDAILLTKEETVARLRRTGFDIASAGYFLFFPGFLRFIRPLEKFIGWLPLGGQYFVAGARP
jgi:SAM-dependent methyltransferase